MKAWRCIRKVDDDDDEITVLCVQFMSNDSPSFIPLWLILRVREGGLSYIFFFTCLLAGLGRLGGFF